jgi:hypothetical protein
VIICALHYLSICHIFCVFIGNLRIFLICFKELDEEYFNLHGIIHAQTGCGILVVVLSLTIREVESSLVSGVSKQVVIVSLPKARDLEVRITRLLDMDPGSKQMFTFKNSHC